LLPTAAEGFYFSTEYLFVFSVDTSSTTLLRSDELSTGAKKLQVPQAAQLYPILKSNVIS